MYRSASVRVANRYLRLKTANSLNSTETQFLDFVSKAIRVNDPKVKIDPNGRVRNRDDILSSATYVGKDGVRETKMRWDQLKSSFDGYVARSLVRGDYLTEGQIADFALGDRQFAPTLEKSVQKEIGGAFFKFSRVVLEDPLYRTSEPYGGDTSFYESEYLKIPVGQRPEISEVVDNGNVSFTIELVAVRASLVESSILSTTERNPSLLDTQELNDDATEEDKKKAKKINKAVVQSVLRQIPKRMILKNLRRVPEYIAKILQVEKPVVESLLDEIAGGYYQPRVDDYDSVSVYSALRINEGLPTSRVTNNFRQDKKELPPPSKLDLSPPSKLDLSPPSKDRVPGIKPIPNQGLTISLPGGRILQLSKEEVDFIKENRYSLVEEVSSTNSDNERVEMERKQLRKQQAMSKFFEEERYTEEEIEAIKRHFRLK